MSIDTKSVRYGAFILTAANIVSQLLGFAYRMALTRLIGAEGMGLFQLVFPFYSLCLTITASGIGVAVSRLSAEYMALKQFGAVRKLISKALRIFLLIFAVLSALSLLLARQISSGFLGDERTLLAVYALIPVVFFTGLENIHKNFFYGTKNVNPPALSDLLEQIIRMTSVLVLLEVLMPLEDDLMLVVIACGMLICEIFSSSFLKAVYQKRMRRIPSAGDSDPFMNKRLMNIALPITITNLLNNLISSMIVIIIPRRLVVSGLTSSAALAEYGKLVGMALPLLNLPAALIVGMGLVLVPKLAENRALGNYTDMQNKISRAIGVVSFLVLPILAVMVPLGAPLTKLLFKQEITDSYMLPLALGMLFAIYMVILGNILNGLGKQTVSSINFFIGNVVELAITYYAVSEPSLRMSGYVFALLASTVLTFALNLRVVTRECRLRVDWMRWFIAPALAGTLAALIARLVFLLLSARIPEWAALLAALGSAACAYLPTCKTLGFGFNDVIGGLALRVFGRRSEQASR